MSYPTVQAALLAIVRKTAEFDASNSSEADTRILGKGKQKACFVRFGGQSHTKDGVANRIAFHWTVLVEMWFRGRGEVLFYNADISTAVQSVMEAMFAYPTLDGTTGITDVTPGDSSEPNRWQGELRDWWVITIPVLITEKQVITILE